MSDGIRDGLAIQNGVLGYSKQPGSLHLGLVVACSLNNVIGDGPRIPWDRIKGDLPRFKKLTLGHNIIMGRKTYETIGSLPGRRSIVLTRGGAWHDIKGAAVVGSLHEALNLVLGDPEPFVIGGGEIYKLFMPYVQTIYLTTVLQNVVGNITFDPPKWNEICRQESADHNFAVLKRPSA
jgi:dihydrofolate reductase